MTALEVVKAYFTTADYIIVGATAALAVLGLAWGISHVIDFFYNRRAKLPPLVRKNLAEIRSRTPEPKPRYRFIGRTPECSEFYLFEEIRPDGTPTGRLKPMEEQFFWEGMNLGDP